MVATATDAVFRLSEPEKLQEGEFVHIYVYDKSPGRLYREHGDTEWELLTGWGPESTSRGKFASPVDALVAHGDLLKRLYRCS